MLSRGLRILIFSHLALVFFSHTYYCTSFISFQQHRMVVVISSSNIIIILCRGHSLQATKLSLGDTASVDPTLFLFYPLESSRPARSKNLISRPVKSLFGSPHLLLWHQCWNSSAQCYPPYAPATAQRRKTKYAPGLLTEDELMKSRDLVLPFSCLLRIMMYHALLFQQIF